MKLDQLKDVATPSVSLSLPCIRRLQPHDRVHMRVSQLNPLLARQKPRSLQDILDLSAVQ